MQTYAGSFVWRSSATAGPCRKPPTAGKPECEDIPVIVVTGRDITQDRRRELAGVERILPKGEVTPRQIPTALRNAGLSPADER